MKHLNIATVAYDACVTVRYSQSLVNTVMACTKAKIGVTTDYRIWNCYVHNGRNWLIDRFLKSDADTLLFTDSDVGWDGNKVVTLYESGLEVCGGAYPLKQVDEGYPTELTGGFGMDDHENTYLDVHYLPAGFLMIRREVFEKLMPTTPQYRDRYNNNEKTYAFFQNQVCPEGDVGEDVYFCNKWRALGGRIWLLPNITFQHQGGKEWEGNMANYLEAKAEVDRTIARLEAA